MWFGDWRFLRGCFHILQTSAMAIAVFHFQFFRLPFVHFSIVALVIHFKHRSCSAGDLLPSLLSSSDKGGGVSDESEESLSGSPPELAAIDASSLGGFGIGARAATGWTARAVSATGFSATGPAIIAPAGGGSGSKLGAGLGPTIIPFTGAGNASMPDCANRASPLVCFGLRRIWRKLSQASAVQPPLRRGCFGYCAMLRECHYPQLACAMREYRPLCGPDREWELSPKRHQALAEHLQNQTPASRECRLVTLPQFPGFVSLA